MFETRSLIGKKFFLLAAWSLMSLLEKTYRIGYSILAICVGVWVSFTLSAPYLLLLLAVIGVGNIPLYILILSEGYERRLCGKKHEKRYDIYCSFGVDAIMLKNMTTLEETRTQYGEIKRFVKTKNYYMIVLRGRIVAIVNRAELTEKEQSDLISMLAKRTEIKKFK